MIIIHIILRQRRIDKNVEVHKCTLNPIGANLVTNSPIPVHKVFECIIG